MLWCLLRLLQLRIDGPIPASDGHCGRLVLEPKNRGGVFESAQRQLRLALALELRP